LININFGEVFKSIGSFLGKNWQAVALVAVIVLFFVSKNDFGALKKSMEVMTVSYQEQIQAMESLHRRELELREESIANYEKKIAELNKKYEEAIDNLRKNREKDVSKFKRDFEEQPDELAKEIQQQFGFRYVE
jgi:F0F1-type ATP synthase membrane subunit b/b'|tara:strand:+ start:46 stop:447 length:402 start_codon:yes stop_codon:yes gene_type:complete